jgi:hypothetical protein
MRANPLVDAFIRFFGDLKFFKVPPVVVWDPGSYRVKGRDARVATELVEPGDVLVRGYLGYVDGWFIPGYFSHAALYLGEVHESDRALCTELPRSRERWRGESRRRPRPPDAQFAAGRQMVVHALAEGVLLEDLLDFCRCDYMAILRLPDVLHGSAAERPHAGLTPAEARIDARLRAGEAVSRAQAFQIVREVALSKVGYPYDTTFDFTDFRRLSCTEFVYFAARCLSSALDVAPQEKRVLLVKRTIIDPDDYVRSAVLREVWRSPSVKEERWRALRPPPAGTDDVADESARVA